MLDYVSQLATIMPSAITGRVAQTCGATVAVAGFPAPLGAVARIDRPGDDPVLAQVVGFRDHLTHVAPLSAMLGIRHGSPVHMVRTRQVLAVGDALLGRVVDAQGNTIDDEYQPALPMRIPLHREPPAAINRPRIEEPLSTGVRSIDGLLTCGKGQRLGIFAGSGVGKSVLLGMMARASSADVNVIALIGERGREVQEFIERDLGSDALARSVVVVATSDQSPLLRLQAAFTATCVAEFFRDQGKDVLLLMDSVTRFAMAQREIGLSAGEPPTTRGYPPSVFSLLPQLVERAGRSQQGSITGYYTVLVEGDDLNEPVSDAVRGLLDGHIVLSRALAAKGHYPAVDVLGSISRLMPEVVADDQLATARLLRQVLSAWRDHEDLISIGAYQRGSNRLVDVAIDMKDEIDAFLQQDMKQGSSVSAAGEQLMQLAQKCAQASQAPSGNKLGERGPSGP